MSVSLCVCVCKSGCGTRVYVFFPFPHGEKAIMINSVKLNAGDGRRESHPNEPPDIV